MDLWYLFWTVNFVVAGAAFVGIAAVVSVRGVADLRAMFTALSRRSGRERNQ